MSQSVFFDVSKEIYTGADKAIKSLVSQRFRNNSGGILDAVKGKLSAGDIDLSPFLLPYMSTSDLPLIGFPLSVRKQVEKARVLYSVPSVGVEIKKTCCLAISESIRKSLVGAKQMNWGLRLLEKFYKYLEGRFFHEPKAKVQVIEGRLAYDIGFLEKKTDKIGWLLTQPEAKH